MEGSFEIDADRCIARVKLHGEFIVDEFLELYEKLLLDPQFSPAMSVVWDARDVSTVGLTSSHLQRIGSFVREKGQERGEGKAAWVVAADFEFGMGRMYELTTERDIPVTFRVFRSLEDANQWVMK